MPRRSKIHSSTIVAALAGAAIAGALSGRAMASEGGASFYLLGSGGPEVAVLPPVKGVFFDNQLYAYTGSGGGGKVFPIGGKVVADLKVNLVADFPTVLTVPSTHFLGGVLALGGAVPIGGPTVDVSAVLTGPAGRQISASASDSTFVVGDPIATAALGWQLGKYSVQVSDLLNIPIGQYRDGALANLAFHRWADDVSLASTWHDTMSGWDVSAKAGVTFNGTNPSTHYYTGTEFHIEGSIEKTFAPAWSAGIQAYYFDQLTNDGGSGNAVGAFKGEVTGVGGSAAYHFEIGKKPATLRLKVMTEFDATNRVQGTSGVFDLSFPFSLQLPAG